MTVDHRLDAIDHRRTVGPGCGHAGQLLIRQPAEVYGKEDDE